LRRSLPPENGEPSQHPAAHTERNVSAGNDAELVVEVFALTEAGYRLLEERDRAKHGERPLFDFELRPGWRGLKRQERTA
jgi:hypothetical protein